MTPATALKIILDSLEPTSELFCALDKLHTSISDPHMLRELTIQFGALDYWANMADYDDVVEHQRATGRTCSQFDLMQELVSEIGPDLNTLLEQLTAQ